MGNCPNLKRDKMLDAMCTHGKRTVHQFCPPAELPTIILQPSSTLSCHIALQMQEIQVLLCHVAISVQKMIHTQRNDEP